jgi:hypothetical protein
MSAWPLNSEDQSKKMLQDMFGLVGGGGGKIWTVECAIWQAESDGALVECGWGARRGGGIVERSEMADQRESL